MAKSLDSRQVEYCYLQNLLFNPCATIRQFNTMNETYSILVTLVFELKDSNKTLLKTHIEEMILQSGLTTKPTYTEALTKLNDSKDLIATKIAEVKVEKSGYTIS